MSRTEDGLQVAFKATPVLHPIPNHYCPGCAHGIVHRLVGEVIEELGLIERTIGVASVGCSVLAYNYFDLDFISAPHGRAPAVATGLKRSVPDSVVFTYQGDGDLAAIGTAEIIHAAVRGENITVIYYNNAIYGMTGGQMSPTTLPGMVTATTPLGRDTHATGFPFKIADLLALVEGSAYIARVAPLDVAGITRAKKAIKKAFQVQLAGQGFSLVEVVGTCPTGWGLTPVEAVEWCRQKMLPVYPLGELKAPGLPAPRFIPAYRVGKE